MCIWHVCTCIRMGTYDFFVLTATVDGQIECTLNFRNWNRQKGRGYQKCPMEISNGCENNEKAKEGISRGDTTTNLHNFSWCIFLVPVKNSQKTKVLFWEPRAENKVNTGPGSHDMFFGNVQHNEDIWRYAPTGPTFDFSGWESRIMNPKATTNPTGPLGTQTFKFG